MRGTFIVLTWDISVVY